MRQVATAVVDVPVEHVWEVLADHEGMSSWGPIKVTLDKQGAPHRNGLGAVRRIKAPGPAPAIVEQITTYEPGKRLGYKALSGVPFKNYNGEVVLSRSVNGTSIEYSISVDRRIPLVDAFAAKLVGRALLALLVRASKRS